MRSQYAKGWIRSTLAAAGRALRLSCTGAPLLESADVSTIKLRATDTLTKDAAEGRSLLRTAGRSAARTNFGFYFRAPVYRAASRSRRSAATSCG